MGHREGRTRSLVLENTGGLIVPKDVGSFSLWLHCSCHSVAQSCPILYDPMDYSTPGFPEIHHLPEFVHTHVH